MNKFIFLSLFLFSLVATSTWAQNVDTRHLALFLRFDIAKKQAAGHAIFTGTVLTASDSIFLDAGHLSIRSIQQNGQSLSFRNDGADSDNNLRIRLNKRFVPGELFTLKIEYHTNHVNQSDPMSIGGSFGKGLRFMKPTSTSPSKQVQVWSSGEPDYNKYWFPCNEEMADIHTTELHATIEQPFIVIGNGKPDGITPNPDNTRTFHYKADKPFPNYLVSVVAGNFCDVVQKSGTTTLHHFGYPHEKEAISATVELVPDMMKFLEEKTGYAYPFQHYSQIMVQDYPFPGMTGQHSAAILSDNYVDDDGVHKDFCYLWDGVAVQALANQWFGNLIMPVSWKDIWLNNAFAQYFAGLYTEKIHGKAEYLLWYYPFEKGNIQADWDAENRHPIVPDEVRDLAGFTTDSYSKYRGALVLRMLQKELGDEVWWKVVRHFVKENAGKQVQTKDFQNAVEAVAGKSFQWFFDQWIYRIGQPVFDVSSRYLPETHKLVLTVKQTMPTENKTRFELVPYFQGKLDIETDAGVFPIGLKPMAENTFEFVLSKRPEYVHFNVHGTFLSESNFQRDTASYLRQLEKSRDVLARKSALDTLVLFAKDSAISTAAKEKIIGAFSREIQSGQYWRYRLYALGSLQKILTPPYSPEIQNMLKDRIRKESSWVKSSAINMLGKTGSPDFKDVYVTALDDKSDRVINSAAIALGKTKDPSVLPILLNLESKHSWKNQNRISALNGLQQLGDPKGAIYAMKCLEDNRSPRWYLATPVWDYPFAAVHTLVALGKAGEAYPLLQDRLKQSLKDEDLNDVFQNVQLINLLGDLRAKEVYQLLEEKFRQNESILNTVKTYKNQFLESIQK